MLPMAILIFILLLGPAARALDVAFVEIHDQNGQPTQLEPDGRFMHIAVRIGTQWLHAHSENGVDLVDDIYEYGDKVVILRNPRVVEINRADFAHWLGKGFDFTYSWTNKHATYCSRLIAELLVIPPQPMQFKAKIWNTHIYRDQAIGEPGLSPDDIFRVLLGRGYRPVIYDCERRLEKVL